MTLAEIKNLYHQKLETRYTESEIKQLFTIFVEEILKMDSLSQRKALDNTLQEADVQKLINSLNEIETGKPYQQVLGKAHFFGMEFFVNEHVLIPRPETEELLEIAIAEIDKVFATNSCRMLEIGTGSGIIPIVLKKHFSGTDIISIDYSEEALTVAKRNAQLHQTDIRFVHADYLNYELQEPFDVIISNPPYIGLNEFDEIGYSVKDYEPRMALFSPTNNPLVFYEKIAQDCTKLNHNGLLFLEINQKLGPETSALYQNRLKTVHLLTDISGNNRFIYGKK